MMISKLLSATALAGLALTTASCTKEAKHTQPPAAVHSAVSNTAPNRAALRAPTDRRELVEEATAALRETQNALVAIDQHNQAAAIGALERATGKLEIVLARTPELALAPVDVAVATTDLVGSVQDVEAVRNAAKAALDRGRLQDARRLVSNLASETVVSTSNLPLATYPAAIKQAAALLQAGKPEEAKAVLETALGTIVVQRETIPLPLVRAQAAIEAARGLSQKPNRTPAESATLHTLVASARDQLRFGQALGYATEKDMSDLLAEVDQIDRKTSGQQYGTGLLDRIGHLFDSARKSSQAQVGKR